MSTIVTRATKGSALTWTEGDANITNLNTDKLENVSDDTNPQLGGNLDVNGKTILGGSYGGNQVILPVGFGTTIKSLYEGGVNFVASGDGGSTSKNWKMNIDGTTDFPAFKFPAADGTADYVLKTNGAGVLSWTALPTTGMTSFTAAGDTGTSQTVANGNTLTIAGGTGLSSVASATDTVTVNLDNTAVTAGSYTYANFTVDAQGRLTAAASGTTPLVSGGALGTPSSGTVTNLTGTASININGTVGATTANTGAFTTVAASTTTTNGAVNATYNPSTATGAAIQTTGGITQGGAGYFDFLKPTNSTAGATNANKSFRLNSTGALEIINSGYTTTILSLTDAGVLTTPSIISSGALTFKDPREALYDIGTTGGTVAPNCANGSVQKITLNAALTINAFTSPVAGQSLTLIIYGGTAYTSITSTMKFAGGIKTLTGTASCIDILSVYYDGTNYFASLGKGFA